jgi:hypothetical protein
MADDVDLEATRILRTRRDAALALAPPEVPAAAK